MSLSVWHAALILLASLGLLLLAFVTVWAATRQAGDVSVVDSFWGLGFVALAGFTFALAQPPRIWPVIFLGAVTVWGLRLARHMFVKHARLGREDPRYAAMRQAQGDGFARWSLIWIFLLQAVILWIAAAPVHVALLAAVLNPPPGLAALGLLIFLIGFGIECLADWQLARFKARPENAGAVLDRGLWGLSRHPNYFGEAVLWWGLALMAFAIAGAHPVAAIAFIGPALMTFLLLRVSGVALIEPMLEATKPAYTDYRRRVSAFIPWFPARR